MAHSTQSNSNFIQPTPVPASAAMAQSPPTKQGLKKWWANFKNSPKPEPQAQVQSHIFGVPLRQSITYANVAISLIDSEGRSYIYGYVPIIVAKCGVYLKEQATETQGIFRLSGSEKRIKELKTQFDSPERYGKGLDWSGYNVHDAANVLRRYLNELPEPIIPLDLYERFREPLRGVTTLHQQQRSIMENSQQAVETPEVQFDMDGAIATYQQLITELPPLNRQLLLYILDLLAVFASKAEINLMTPSNLAAIFQPCMLNHPDHDMSPQDYILNQNVLIFLIENQDHFLIGMTGTAADEQTVQQVQQGGTPPQAVPNSPTPTRSKTTVVRSASTASAGAESVLKNGAIRRNASTASRRSRQSTGTPSPASPALTTSSASGVHRSNTVPSKRSPALTQGRLQKTSNPLTPATPTRVPSVSLAVPEVVSPSLNEAAKPELSPTSSSVTATVGDYSSLAAADNSGSGRSQEQLLGSDGKEATTPSKERTMSSLFQRSPGSEDRRQPNKLRKKRLPGSANPSAQSSTHSLHSAQNHLESPKLEPVAPSHEVPDNMDPLPESDEKSVATPVPEAARAMSPNPKVTTSSASVHSRSSVQENSDFDTGEATTSGGEKEERKSRWRGFHRRKDEPLTPKKTIGSNGGADVSSSSINSASHPTAKTLTTDTSTTDNSLAQTQLQSSNDSGSGADGSKDDKRGPIDWLKTKMREAKEEKRERDAEKERAKSPPASDRGGSSSLNLPIRAKSTERKQQAEASTPAPSAGAAPTATATQEQSSIEPTKPTTTETTAS